MQNAILERKNYTIYYETNDFIFYSFAGKFRHCLFHSKRFGLYVQLHLVSREAAENKLFRKD